MKTLIGNLAQSLTQPRPVIECYLSEKRLWNGISLVIFPGGGYRQLGAHEGKGYADFFSREGISCFVVTYRLSSQDHKHPAMLEDALAAISAVRSQATELGIDPHRIGVIGSSAGGHLAAHTLVSYDRYKSKISLRPDFGILCYPVIMMAGKYCHKGTRVNLIGKNPSKALVDEVSCERHVSSQTPPCFIWHTWEDDAVPVENSILFAAALRKHKVPFELHIYQKGGHGLGLNTDLPWAQECLRWLKEIAQ